MPSSYPPLNIVVRTPKLLLVGATDEWLERLIPTVQRGVIDDNAAPFDDPMSLYAPSPEREWRWLRGIWAGRGHVSPNFWRLYFVVVVEGEAVGMQDVVGVDFATYASVTTFSWLSPDVRGLGLGREMRSAALHLAFLGLSAREATSEAFADNAASNSVSQRLGYQPNGTAWATRRGEPALLQRWRLTRENWASERRTDIDLDGVDAALPVLGAS